ncbi:MAG TPA: aromatic acid/H+ symport family MFS transporter [Pseudonocardia sp.]
MSLSPSAAGPPAESATLPSNERPALPSRSPLIVVALCFLTLIFDGYDNIVYGSVVPALLAEPVWHLGPAAVGVIGSYAAVGMLFGALISGPLADRIGRRRLILIAITWFSVFTALCAVAPTPGVLGLLRLVAGLGLGGVLPSAVALTIEFAPRSRRQLFNAVMSTGFPLGGLLAAVVALLLLPDHGWRAMFLVGLVPVVIIVPLAAAYLPESPGHLASRGRRDEAAEIARRYGLDVAGVQDEEVASSGLRAVLTGRNLGPTLLFGVGSFCALLLTYGLSTWLPQIMRQAGYPLGSALQFLLLLNLGAIVLGVVAGWVADRRGPKFAIICSFAAAGLSLLLLGTGPGAVLVGIGVFVAGLGGTATQVLVHGYVAAYFSAANRASALGVVLALGRLGAIVGPLLGGLLLASGLAIGGNFLVFAIPALLGLLATALGPRVVRHTSTQGGSR